MEKKQASEALALNPVFMQLLAWEDSGAFG
jgi:hypothetical protein